MLYHNPTRPASENQRKVLQEMKVSIPARLNSSEANDLIKAHYWQWAFLPPTKKQVNFLIYHRRWVHDMTRKEATELISKITGNQDWILDLFQSDVQDSQEKDQGGSTTCFPLTNDPDQSNDKAPMR